MTLILRPQADADREAVQQIIAAAFADADNPGATPVEVGLNAELLDHPALSTGLTLVAELDGVVVGQVTCSYGTLTTRPGDGAAESRPVIGVGPVSVRPDQQGAGIGSALMRELVAAADGAGEVALVLLGEPAFYRRFGFVPAGEFGVLAPDPVWGNYFQLRPHPTAAASLAGSYRYAEPFDRL